jgi:MtrB/PioB family decaheme-associated outer membrane protein
MKRKLVLSVIAASLLATGAWPLASQAADMVTKAAVAPADPGWYFFGEVEAGGRFFLNNPEKHGIASLGQKSLGKYYEYESIKPGPFGSLWLDWGTKNGIWDYNITADNIGYDDQRYELNASKAGEYYLTFMWDQTPHVYSTNALTMYQGLGSNHLTLAPGLSNSLFLAGGCTRAAGAQPNGCTTANPAAAATNAAQTTQETAIQNIINNNSYTTDLGIRRDTAAVGFRWTPSDAWDVNFDYSHMHRHGSQVEGVVFSPGTSGVVAQVPKPVNDSTQNFGVNGEYKGTSPWGQLFTLKMGYAGSVYRDEWNSYTVDNPFCPTGAGPGECARNGSPSSPTAQMGLWPNNQAHGFAATTGLDLPMKSRYMGTISYTMMRQNDAFLPFTNQPLIFTGANTALASPTAAGLTLPAGSLNGAINNFLSNNVLTTQIVPTLKNKASYRYFNSDNNTPELLFNNWVVTDVKTASATTATYAPVNSLAISYTKQNAGDELVWSPNKQWNIGGGYGYERYDWTRADANATNENSGKLFADYKPWSWVTARASWVVGDRRSDNYDYRGNVGNFQWANAGCQVVAGCSTQYSQAMRQFYLDNRQRQIGKFQVAVDVARGLTLTPFVGYQDDVYKLDMNTYGLTRSQSTSAGLEVAYAITPLATMIFSYTNEQYRQNLRYTTVNNITTLPVPGSAWNADIRDNVNTFMAAVNWTAIPQKLDFRFAYSLSVSRDSQPIVSDAGATPVAGNVTPGTGGQFPDVTGRWSRFEATGKYTFDKETVRSFGINGEAYAKLRYVWEGNSVNNYDQDVMAAYMSPLINNTGFMTWMAYNNPNYNVHLLGASVGVRW